MPSEINSKNLYTLIPYKAAKIAAVLRRDRKMGVKQALLTFYQSQAYRLLEHEETKLWHASPEQIYAEYLMRKPSSPRHHYQNGPRHSKLVPYAGRIQTWKRQGMTLREIAAELEQYGCSTTAQNLSLFLKKQKRSSAEIC